MQNGRLIFGRCYLDLYEGENQPTEVRSTPGHHAAYYNDPAIKLSRKDVRSFLHKPILIEHGNDPIYGNRAMGKIIDAKPDKDNHMRVTAKIFDDDVYSQVKNGNLKGLSVGYVPKLSNGTSGKVEYKDFNEISLCKNPFFPGAEVTVTASKNLAKQREKKYLWIAVMASEQAPTPVEENKEAEELLRGAEENAKIIEQQALKLKELEEIKAHYHVLKKAEDERLQAVKAEKVKEAEKMIQMAAEVYKKDKGVDLPETFADVIRKSWQTVGSGPEQNGVSETTAILASLISFGHDKAKKEEDWEKERASLTQKIKDSSNRLNASREAAKVSEVKMSMESGKNLEPETGVKSQGVGNIFRYRAPSQNEIECYELDPSRLNTAVNASAGGPNVPLHEPRQHAYVNELPNSMRYHSGNLFAFAAKNEFTLYRPPNMRVEHHFETPETEY